MTAVSAAALHARDSAAFISALARLSAPMMLHSAGVSFGSELSLLGDRVRATVSPPDIDSSLVLGALCAGLNGYGARDIIAKGDSASTRITVEFDRRFAASFIDKLKKAKEANELVRDSLAALKIESATLRQQDGILGLESEIVMSLTNGTAHNISRAYFSATSISEGRETPWLREDFNHVIPGGLVAGEKATWHLKPNMFSGDWNKVRVPKDAQFKVEAVKLEGTDGTTLWGGPEFTVVDQHRLDSLTALEVRH
jgi:hypothetical protein